MKPKKLSLTLNKETLVALDSKEMSNIQGGEMLFSSAFWCVDSKCVCAPPDGTTPTPTTTPTPAPDSQCDASPCASAHSVTKGTGCGIYVDTTTDPGDVAVGTSPDVTAAP